MNVYYILAVIALASSALFGYLGTIHDSKKSNAEQLGKISGEFKKLSQQINDLNKAAIASSDIETVNTRYQNLAKQYMKALPAEAQSLLVEKEAYKLEQINQSTKITSQIEVVRNTARNVVAAFTRTGARITYEDMPVPSNLFSADPFQLKLQCSEKEYWSIHLVDREPEKIGLMFVRISKTADKKEYLTNDSIIFRWIGDGQFGFSPNSHLSEEVRKKVMGSLDFNFHPIAEADIQLEQIVVNVIKYMLAKAKIEEA